MYRMSSNSKVVLLLLLTIFVSCKSTKPDHTASSKPSLVTFRDSIDASKAIVGDDIDGFFTQISIVDMAIQMKNPKPSDKRDDMLKVYKAYLQKSTSNWTTDDKQAIFEVFTTAKKMLDKISPRIFPGDIKLIKIKTNHYGGDVYYTRGKNILIPENIFESKDFEKQIPVMLHEIFHILSRYDPVLRDDMYKLIGFKKSLKPVELDPKLKQIVLTNPDGVTNQYYMTLTNDDKKTNIIPVIFSKGKMFKTGSPSFFDYLQFELFPLEDTGKVWMTKSTDDGKTTLDVAETPSFFQQIKDNTQYIIHPDEIMADNFMLAVQAYYKDDYVNFTPEGKKLIEAVIARLKEF